MINNLMSILPGQGCSARRLVNVKQPMLHPTCTDNPAIRQLLQSLLELQ
jgi:hypothetical protein